MNWLSRQSLKKNARQVLTQRRGIWQKIKKRHNDDDEP